MDPREREVGGTPEVPKFPIQAVILDWDGLLADTPDLWFKAAKSTGASFGVEVLEEDKLEICSQGSLSLFMINKYGISATREEVKKMNDANYRRFSGDVRAMPGGIELVRILAERFPLAIASSSGTEIVRWGVKRFFLEGHFKAIVGGEQVGIGRGKPHPDIYIETAKRLGTDPIACLAIEDSPNGAKAARDAGMRCIVVPHPGLRGSFRDGAFKDVNYLVPDLTSLHSMGIVNLLEGVDPRVRVES